jgi:hypothetical protein
LIAFAHWFDDHVVAEPQLYPYIPPAYADGMARKEAESSDMTVRAARVFMEGLR